MRVVAFVIGLGLMVTVAVAQDPAWKWSDDQIKAMVHRVRGGKTLMPSEWPNGARAAVALSFDVDNETPALSGGAPTIGALSQGEYGARAGLQRVVNLLDRNQIPASFFIPAVSLMLHPEMTGVIQKSGRHEFGIHGWIHEQNSTLTREDEKSLVSRALDYMEKATGSRPVGYRAPSWNFSPNTLAIIRELGFSYDSSLMSDDRPYELLDNGQATGLVELPVEWILDDAPLLNPRGQAYSSPRDLLSVYIDEFDRAYEERGLFLLTTHPHIMGHRSRIVILERLIEHIRSKGNVWFATHRQVAEYVKR